MADGMTKGEIEDVLSSIRRLVSDGNRPVFRAAPRPFAREAEKLILTPSLRVLPTDTGDRPAPAARFALTGNAPAQQASGRPSLGTVVTAIAAAVPPPVEGWEPEVGDAAVPFGPAGQADDWIDTPAPRDDAASPQDASPPQADTALAWEDVGPDDDGWEVEDGAADPAAPPQPELTAAAPEMANAAPAVDHAVLAEMIRSILREELRGPLGERITGNLRKLVRAEVARALTLHGED